jgi:hypothetical protein
MTNLKDNVKTFLESASLSTKYMVDSAVSNDSKAVRANARQIILMAEKLIQQIEGERG